MNINSTSWCQKIITLITFSVMFSSAQAAVMPLAVESLKPLRTNDKAINEATSQKNVTQLAAVVMIYQPDCSWCKKQGEVLAKAFEQCHSSIAIALIGTKGKARQLRKELKHYHHDIPAYQANRQFLRSIGGYQASPTTLIYNNQGVLIAKKRGFISKEKLTKAFSMLTNGQCQL